MNPFKPVTVFFSRFFLILLCLFSYIFIFVSCISLFALIETEVQTLFQNFALIISLFYISPYFLHINPIFALSSLIRTFYQKINFHISQYLISVIFLLSFCFLSLQVYIFLFRINFFYIFIPFDCLLFLFHSHLYCLLYFVIFYSFLLCSQSALL